ncbi:MAG: hypothetical protein JW774_10745 [Candidatus Aureabacteria bacterium]|nr:hypothetical protein [Candidatus Auribacterota bacterium]
MKGYILTEAKFLKPFHKDGLKPNDLKIGFLDFLRELQTSGNDLSLYLEYRVTGLEETLYHTPKEKRNDTALYFRKLLHSKASVLEMKKIQVQLVFNGKLIKGDTLWVDYRNEKLPLDFIFGTAKKQDTGNISFYTASFNLTS